ncbi:MAG: gentisate 1,2-dioxygenase [Pseudomonadota bacterium]
MASVIENRAGGSVSEARREFYRRMDRDNLAPLWEVLHALVPPAPQSSCRAALWKYRAIRPYIEESGRIISAREAVRRVLVLENPGMRGQSRITTSLYCGLQLILPGEIAPSHRHTQTALRLVVEGSGAYTAVDGERVTMHPGDFIITPAWTWHDHGNPGSQPVVWMDGLDIPIAQLFDATFAENYPEEVQPVTRPEGDAWARYGCNLAPLAGASPFGRTSPVFCYPYGRSREALATLARRGEPDPCHGFKMQYINPTTGGPAMPTIGAFLQLLPAGFRSEPYRSSDATVYLALEGEGTAIVGDETFAFEPRDIFVAPSWQPVRFSARSECVLFSFSDRPAQIALGLWRESRR